MTPADRRGAASSELVAARTALEAILSLVADGRPVFDQSIDRRRHFAYLWIVVGSRLKNHARVLQVARSGGEFGLAIGFRQKLAYSSPEEVDSEVLWRTSVINAPALLRQVEEAIGALSSEG
jgi:hypothetical protein